MPSHPDNYRKKAEECLSHASKAHDLVIKRQFEDLARQWADLAKQIENLGKS